MVCIENMFNIQIKTYYRAKSGKLDIVCYVYYMHDAGVSGMQHVCYKNIWNVDWQWKLYCSPAKFECISC